MKAMTAIVRVLVRALTAVAVLVVVLAAVMAVAAWAAERSTTEMQREIAEAGTPGRLALRPVNLSSLPEPVARYFAQVLPGGQRPIRATRIRWEGEFRLDPNRSWGTFTASQQFSSVPPAFLWDASISVVPLVSVRVRDHYSRQSAGMRARLGGIIPVVNTEGTPELASSALARWLGEAVWFPTALLPPEMGGAVTWVAIDDSTAEATVTDGRVSVRAEFGFATSGLIRSMTALRYRDVDGEPVLSRFEGLYRDYFRQHGILVPGEAEVAWLHPLGRFPYWRGRPTEITWQVEPPR
jgi:hypothetical protein